ncbi:B1 bradykinin receptor [Betta splendens]|uniref:B1 bradykinin receptor n=1 Tax=Betta splendens TaxID=158456 RepID=A0A6P7LMX8_BETSP|nr:B1 bradykinin receptor [Betta splendens]
MEPPPQNHSASLLFNASSADWELVLAAIPPYVLAVALLGLPANAFVLGVLALHRDRLTVAELYLGNLALADFALLCGLPFWAVNVLRGFDWPYGDALCKAVNAAATLNFYTSVYTLVMISVDRYLALVEPMRARWLRRTLYAKVACGLLWALGLLLSAPTLLHRRVVYVEEYGTTSCVLDFQHGSPWKVAHQVLLNTVGFVLPVAVIVLSSAKIVKALVQRQESVSLHDPSDTRAAVLVSAVALLFVLCWGPFQVVTFLDTLYDVRALDERLWSRGLDVGHQVSVYLAFLNSALNPLLYVFSGQYFRRKVSAIYRRTRRRRRRGSDVTACQRSVVSTYINRTDAIKAKDNV